MVDKIESIEAISAANDKRKSAWQAVQDHLWENDPLPSSPPLTGKAIDTRSSAEKDLDRAKSAVQSASIWSTLWRWINAPIVSPDTSSKAITGIAPIIKAASSPLEPPSQIDRAQLDRFVAEMKVMLKQISEVMSGSADDLLEDYYKDQGRLYKMGIRSEDALFVRAQYDKKSLTHQITKSTEELGKLNANAGWWGGINKNLMIATTLSVVAVALCQYFNKSPAANSGIQEVFKNTMTHVNTVFAAGTSCTTIIKAFLDQDFSAHKGASIVLRPKEQY